MGKSRFKEDLPEVMNYSNKDKIDITKPEPAYSSITTAFSSLIGIWCCGTLF